jgi:hypothetical protein
VRTLSEQALVEQLVRDLCSEFGSPHTDVDEVLREVRQVHARYANARVRNFGPTLVYRNTREALKASLRT